jgi:hypothetical protein
MSEIFGFVHEEQLQKKKFKVTCGFERNNFFVSFFSSLSISSVLLLTVCGIIYILSENHLCERSEFGFS